VKLPNGRSHRRPKISNAELDLKRYIFARKFILFYQKAAFVFLRTQKVARFPQAASTINALEKNALP